MVDDNLKDKFPTDGDEPDSVEISAVFADSKVGSGKVFKVDNSRIPPTEDELSVRYEEADDIGTQERRYLDARLAAIAIYEEYQEFAENHALYEVRDIAVSSLKTEVSIISKGGTNRNRGPKDPVRNSPHALIIDKIDQGMSAEAAVDEGYQFAIDRFGGIDDPHFKKLISEMEQHRSVMQHCLKQRPLSTLHDMPQGSILVTDAVDLNSVSHLVDPKTGEKRIEGVIVEEGSMHSHGAILIQAMGIPYARTSQKDHDRFGPGNVVIMDGATDTIHMSPSPTLKKKYGADVQRFKEQEQFLGKKWGSDNFSETADGQKVNVHANFAMSHEAASIRRVNPRGIGLYRTELYIDARENGVTSVDDHLKIIRHNMHACEPNEGRDDFIPMTVRTIDLAGDKSDLPADKRAELERGITYKQMQALAKLKNELAGNGDDRKLKVMVPNIRNSEHFREMQAVMDKAAEAVTLDSIKLGMMVENPGVIRDLPSIDADFFSVGTNDLWHSLHGVHRYGGQSNDLYDPTSPVFLETLSEIIDIGHEKGVPVSLCGNMASEIEYLPLLIGVGYRNISAGAAQVDMQKELVSRVDVAAAEALVAEIIQADTREERETLLQEFNQEQLGLHPDGSLDMINWDTPTPNQTIAREGEQPDVPTAD